MDAFTNVNPEHVARLAEPLRRILDAELAAGNAIGETGSGWPKPGSVMVMLRKPFMVQHDPLATGVRFVEVNDPHWWKADYEFGDDVLACRFGH